MTFCDDYRQYFTAARHNLCAKARCYVAGLLMQAPRKNLERMEEYVAESEYQAQQQFLSDSPWDHAALTVRVGRDVDAVVGGPASALLVDESAFAKKGRASVGVARQWNGRQGKVDNCQVGVFAGLTDGVRCGLVDFRLYLPESWTDDPPRCAAAKMPAEECRYRSKPELALEMVEAAVAHGLRFGWVDVDSGYGSNPAFVRGLEARGLEFVADVHRDQRLYPTDPQPYLPRRTRPQGRKFSRLRSRVTGVEIGAFFADLPARSWHWVTVRDSTQGPLRVQAVRRQVWLWDGAEPVAHRWWAVCIRLPATGETKWFLCHTTQTITLTQLVRRHALRFWIERTFQDAKTSVGMADYQVRGWVAWHHHMALVLLALLFLLRERKLHCKTLELLSCQDIVELLNHYLPRADATEAAVLRNLERRHRKRRLAIDAARRRASTGHGPRFDVTK